MKIIFLNKYQFEVSRGAETFVFELSNRLSIKHNVEIISKINYLELFKKKFDIIIPTNGRMQAVIVRIISFFKGAKMIVSGQSGLGADDKLNLITFPDLFVGLTKYQSEWALKFNPLVKIKTIPNGVDLSRFFPATKKPEKVVLAVGAFTKEKGHEFTIRAVAKIPGVKLIIAGSGGTEKEELVNLAGRLLPDRFEIVTASYSDMPEIYRKSSIFVYPTVFYESFGIAIVEAMASGLAVVVNDDPIRKEIIADAGILTDPKDTEKYSAAIQKALSTDFKDRPRKRAEEFSWDLIANSYEETIQQITSPKK